VKNLLEKYRQLLQKSGIEFEKLDSAPWIDLWEKNAGLKFPEVFRTLVTNFSYFPFSIGEIRLFSNMGIKHYDEMVEAISKDKIIYKQTRMNKYLHFARPEGGSYDPICFDLNKATNNDAPIVLLDHKEMLCFDRVKVISKISDSFLNYVTGLKIEDIKPDEFY
jgi:hypothetical protein